MQARFNPYSAASEGLAGLLGVETYLKSCGLEASLLHLVKTRVSQINGCAFCLHMHTREARADGEREARLYLLNAWRESAMFSARERAALAWAEALTTVATAHAGDDVYEAVRACFSEKELSDLTIAIAMINGWNRIAIGARSVHPGEREGNG
ncbi:MAG: carboxymuconolactone decarboxylase family protein [Alphaproteobacteria bacterium]|nr:carboxymuconolactone decarboxylase family protein [Alphaproteobacteria bacterium]